MRSVSGLWSAQINIGRSSNSFYRGRVRESLRFDVVGAHQRANGPNISLRLSFFHWRPNYNSVRRWSQMMKNRIAGLELCCCIGQNVGRSKRPRLEEIPKSGQHYRIALTWLSLPSFWSSQIHIIRSFLRALLSGSPRLDDCSTCQFSNRGIFLFMLSFLWSTKHQNGRLACSGTVLSSALGRRTRRIL